MNTNELTQLIIRAKHAYYNLTKPIMSDDKYDTLIDELEQRYPHHPLLIEVGAPVTDDRRKVELPFFLGSMNKIKPTFGKPNKKLDRFHKKYAGPYVISHKLDGVSLLVTCKNNQIKIFTRGNGEVGHDVSHLQKYLQLPTSIQESYSIRGEAIINKADWKEHTVDLKVSNPRNTVSGLINSKMKTSTSKKGSKKECMKTKINSVMLPYLSFVAYELIEPSDMKPSEQFRKLEEMGCLVCPYEMRTELEETQLIEHTKSQKQNGLYEMDGIIITDDNVHPRNDKGNPSHSIAFKIDDENAFRITEVVDVLWEASQWGKLIPRIKLKPVHIQVRIEYVSGYNANYIVDNKIGKGAKVKVIRSGDVIPKVVEVIKSSPPKNVIIPEGVWKSNDIYLREPEKDKHVQIKRLERFLKVIGVKNVKYATLEPCFNVGLDSIQKLLTATKEEWVACERIGEKKAGKMVSAIREKWGSATLLVKMNASMCFGETFGEKKINKIVKQCEVESWLNGDLLSSEAAIVKTIDSLSGFSQESAQKFYHGLCCYQQWMNKHM